VGKPTAKQTWVGLVIAILTLATSYLTVDKYQQSQIVIEAPDVNVAITSSATRSDEDIKAMIKTLVNAKMKEHITDGKRH